jgi:hypothetical protein
MSIKKDKEYYYQEKMNSLKLAWSSAKKDENYLDYIKNHHLSQLKEIELEKHRETNFVRIVASGPGGRVCPACKEMDGKVINLENEIENQSLPSKTCTCTAYEPWQEGFCLCGYEVVFKDEL